MPLGQTPACHRVNRAKKFMCSPRCTGNINFSLWLTGGLSQGCPHFQKFMCSKFMCLFLALFFKVWVRTLPAWERGFRASGPNRKKYKKHGFRPPPENRKKLAEKLENATKTLILSNFPIFQLIFSYFARGRLKSVFSLYMFFLPFSGRRPEIPVPAGGQGPTVWGFF